MNVVSNFFDLVPEQRITTSYVANLLETFDWLYEYSNTDWYRERLGSQLELIETAVWELWKQEPAAAIKIWNEYSPYGSTSSDGVPSFILRRQVEENIGV